MTGSSDETDAGTVFDQVELDYLTLRREQDGPRPLGRLATVGPDGMPHITPVGWSVDPDSGVVEIGGYNLTATKKFRDVARTGRAALVIDDVLPPWQPRGVEIRGTAEALTGAEHDRADGEPNQPVIRIHPRRIVSWGLIEGSPMHERRARDIPARPESSG